jgi:hypothetical protein
LFQVEYVTPDNLYVLERNNINYFSIIIKI